MTTISETMELKLIIHASTIAALARARSNAANLLATRPDAQVRIVANAGAVSAALLHPDPRTDERLVLCHNSLASRGLQPGNLAVTPAAVLLIAELQAAGWAYMHA